MAVQVNTIQVLGTSSPTIRLDWLSLVIDHPPDVVPFDLANHMHHLVMHDLVSTCAINLDQVYSIEFARFGGTIHQVNRSLPEHHLDHKIKCQYLEVTSSMDLTRYLTAFCEVQYLSWFVWNAIETALDPIEILALQPEIQAIGLYSDSQANQLFMSQAFMLPDWHVLDTHEGIILYRHGDTLDDPRVRNFFALME
jgi:hypothetical protein